MCRYRLFFRCLLNIYIDIDTDIYRIIYMDIDIYIYINIEKINIVALRSYINKVSFLCVSTIILLLFFIMIALSHNINLL